MSNLEIPKIKKIILSAMMIAIYLILDRFISIKTPILKISFIFIPIIISAIYLGPIYTGIIAGIGDLIGALLFPFGTYILGFTISAILTRSNLWDIFI